MTEFVNGWTCDRFNRDITGVMSCLPMDSGPPETPGVSGDSCRVVAVLTAKDQAANEFAGLLIFELDKGSSNPADLFKLVPAENIAENLSTSGSIGGLSVVRRCQVNEITVNDRKTRCRIFARVEKSK